MALGGGTFLTQNKTLPGMYMIFISMARASAQLSDRGYGALPLMLDWGPDDEVFTVETGDIQKNSMQLFGYDYTAPQLMPIRDFFRHAKTGYFYRLNSGEKAQNTLATAAYSGIRGNKLTIIVQQNVDDEDLFDVTTMMDGLRVDMQSVASMADLTDNDYIIWRRTATLEETAGMPLTGGTNSTNVTGAQHQAFLDKVEPYSFNTLGCPSSTATIADLYAAFTKRMRDEVGAKFQCVAFNRGADYEGFVNVKNKVLDEGADEASLVYWMTGASAGCPVNKSNLNRIYDGEYTVDVPYTQTQLTAAIKAGELVFHKVGDTVRVLEDINSLVTETLEKGEDFKSNQTIRVLDQIGNDVAALFNNKYLGQYPNTESGRISLWNDIVDLFRQLQDLQAIQNFESEDVTVGPGEKKKAVSATGYVDVVNAMAQLYFAIYVM